MTRMLDVYRTNEIAEKARAIDAFDRVMVLEVLRVLGFNQKIRVDSTKDDEPIGLYQLLSYIGFEKKDTQLRRILEKMANRDVVYLWVDNDGHYFVSLKQAIEITLVNSQGRKTPLLSIWSTEEAKETIKKLAGMTNKEFSAYKAGGGGYL